MLVSAVSPDEPPRSSPIDKPDEGFAHIKTFVCETDQQFRELVAQIENSIKDQEGNR